MAQDSENAQSRLSNIEAVVPILGALRTISLGNWQGALNRRVGLEDYTQGLLGLLPPVLQKLPRQSRQTLKRNRTRKPLETRQPVHGIVYALGSERGLCGRYNRTLAEFTHHYVSEQLSPNNINLKVVGARLERALAGLDDPLAISESVPSSLTGMPTFTEATRLISEWLGAYERGEIDFVDISYNANTGTGQYEPRVVRLVPPEVTSVAPNNPIATPSGDDWTYIDTDPLTLFVRIIEQWTSITLYQIMLEAVATEHAARYQLMEAASKNADSLVEELAMAIQSSRRQAITREMQELAAGAGLIG